MTFADPQATGQMGTIRQGGTNPAGNLTQPPSANFVSGGVGLAQATQLSDYKIIRRNGSWLLLNPRRSRLRLPRLS
jgi:ribonucleoside-diphosphate reductase alpha chain